MPWYKCGSTFEPDADFKWFRRVGPGRHRPAYAKNDIAGIEIIDVEGRGV